MLFVEYMVYFRVSFTSGTTGVLEDAKRIQKVCETLRWGMQAGFLLVGWFPAWRYRHRNAALA